MIPLPISMCRADLLPQQAYPILFKICPLTMRTQGILLVRDAILLIGVIPADGEHCPLGLFPLKFDVPGSRRQTRALAADMGSYFDTSR